MKNLIKKTAEHLIAQNQSTTTLEIKEELVLTQPMYYWKQKFISVVMAEFAGEGEFEFTDNGTFRTYKLPNSASLGSNAITATLTKKVPVSQRQVVKLSLTDLARKVQENAGKFITVVHTKKTTGQSNVMNCQVLKDVTPLGAFTVKEKGQVKTFYPSDLLEVRAKNVVYQLK